MGSAVAPAGETPSLCTRCTPVLGVPGMLDTCRTAGTASRGPAAGSNGPRTCRGTCGPRLWEIPLLSIPGSGEAEGCLPDTASFPKSGKLAALTEPCWHFSAPYEPGFGFSGWIPQHPLLVPRLGVRASLSCWCPQTLLSAGPPAPLPPPQGHPGVTLLLGLPCCASLHTLKSTLM